MDFVKENMWAAIFVVVIGVVIYRQITGKSGNGKPDGDAGGHGQHDDFGGDSDGGGDGGD